MADHRRFPIRSRGVGIGADGHRGRDEDRDIAPAVLQIVRPERAVVGDEGGEQRASGGIVMCRLDTVFAVVESQLFQEPLGAIPVLQMIQHELDGGTHPLGLHIHRVREQVAQAGSLREQMPVKRADQSFGPLRRLDDRSEVGADQRCRTRIHDVELPFLQCVRPPLPRRRPPRTSIPEKTVVVR